MTQQVHQAIQLAADTSAAAKGAWVVRPAWTKGRHGGPRRCGWHLMNGGEWAQTFALKRDAQDEADRQNAAIAYRSLPEFIQCAACQDFDPDATCPQCPGRRAPAVWQPIEMAPKDGTNILLVNRKGNMATGLWQGSGAYEGWWLRGGNKPDIFFNHHHGPTHWMPLPAPPATGA